MGKSKKRQPSRTSNHHDSSHHVRKSVARRQHSQDVPKKGNVKARASLQAAGRVPNSENSSSPVKIKVPFVRHDRVLLVGEGDFSFALSLVKHHDVGCVVATCYDDKDTLERKYPRVTKTLLQLSSGHSSHASDGASVDGDSHVSDHENVWRGFSPSSHSESDGEEAGPESQKSYGITKVMYGIDATKLSSAHKKQLKPQSPFTKIVFNFPHVGGLSTDVNRQVRSNQQLLVGFFDSAKSLLATVAHPARSTIARDQVREDEHSYAWDDGDLSDTEIDFLRHGKVIVTLFEGEPYTLWNIRDLARHSGLKVLESFKFPWSAYPGYQHARTIGDITTGKDRSEEGKRRGAWRGEERDARCYVLALKDDDDGRPAPGSKKRKRNDGENDSD